ncbi:bifunctional diaminohydroxyphosphoribosylaminopyrimidine deaminase/5-amino-6-(5-phosphoribosylamino)uracil reductase RibD [Bacillus sp. PS06]|uniref:bifunctional diaminohydroxyphosphoribosylaminopyrimidine deaminase/5-amino-6-(5-phosphoribosylamino)uracil reductase RibD n=1 Tax=Bacillus sp. PS06 TaxID=2764176 RepID=UPI00178149A7|nr:bifunctional diaminohydroxyphosphoribosylaminopyrimidine deaminase/5-amino-6-(5-phosphoribosylamino)uracil reductase RibD [Bacillus sp. PS06]MBD8071507.1 bifunctional diaminohydroxyphosphoribosylaminopyrimidine deaminase/5-amino-6-(5-phosphoribosylamino)uracil reductase RibD [Bacillus sp. PS06]
MSSHEFYMELALKNAQSMKGQTDPNPLVGSVIVNNNAIVGIGAHLKAGEPHAEIHALRMAGEKAVGGTIYVTLEPCSHHGRTGPCAEAIVKAGIKKVVVATLDPNPLVSGNGIKILEDAGLEVIVGICEEKSREMNEVFNKYIVQKIPFVTMKAATTLDGKIAAHTSDSKWITSQEARQDVHQIRNEHRAILVGVNTVIKDNPELTTRIMNGRNPIRVILDSTLRIPLDSKVVTDQLAETWVFTSENHSHDKKRELERHGVRVFITASKERVDIREVLTLLGENGVPSLMVEGGGEVNGAFITQKLVDKLVVYIAPKLIGGKNAPTFLEGTGFDKMSEAVEFSDLNVEKIGPDFKFTGYLK